MVVDGILTAIDACEQGDFFTFGLAAVFVAVWVWNVDVKDVRGDDVEVPGVPVQLGGEVFDVETEVAELEKIENRLALSRRMGCVSRSALDV